jgi:anti-sigma factor RsiW
MNCPLKSEETIDVLLDYSTGRLDAARSTRFEQHRKTCAECATFLAGQTEVWQTLDAWQPEPVSLDFNRRLWQRIDVAAAAPWYRKLADSLSMGAWKPALPLTAAVFLVGMAFMMDHRSPVQVAPANAAAYGVSVAEAQQLEETLDDIQLLRQLDAATGSESAGSKTM